jgi:hypothetical protein
MGFYGNRVFNQANQTWKSPTGEQASVLLDLTVSEISIIIKPNLESFVVGSTITVNSFIPKKIKQSDFVKSFAQMYNLYIDVDKKWLEVFKGLHSDLNEQDIPYVTNADGSVNRQKTAEAMQRISKETVSAAKIENAIRASLTPDEQNQLSINANYQFRGYDTPEKLAVYSNTKYNSQIESNNSLIQKLQGEVGLSTSNPEKQKQLQGIIESLENKNSQLNSELKEELELVMANPSLAKSTIYLFKLKNK